MMFNEEQDIDVVTLSEAEEFIQRKKQWKSIEHIQDHDYFTRPDKEHNYSVQGPAPGEFPILPGINYDDESFEAPNWRFALIHRLVLQEQKGKSIRRFTMSDGHARQRQQVNELINRKRGRSENTPMGNAEHLQSAEQLARRRCNILRKFQPTDLSAHGELLTTYVSSSSHLVRHKSSLETTSSSLAIENTIDAVVCGAGSFNVNKPRHTSAFSCSAPPKQFIRWIPVAKKEESKESPAITGMDQNDKRKAPAESHLEMKQKSERARIRLNK